MSLSHLSVEGSDGSGVSLVGVDTTDNGAHRRLDLLLQTQCHGKRERGVEDRVSMARAANARNSRE